MSGAAPAGLVSVLLVACISILLCSSELLRMAKSFPFSLCDVT